MTAVIIDIIVLLIIWFSTTKGLKRGAIRTLFDVISFALAAIVTAVVYKPVTEYALTLNFAKKWSALINDHVLKGINNTTQIESWPKWIENSLTDTVSNTSTALADNITQILISILCIIIIYILVKLLLSVFVGVLDTVFKLPVLKQINKVGGLGFGLVKSLMIIWLICAGIVLLAPTSWFTGINDSMQQTYIAQYFYNNNVLMKWIMGIM